MTGMNLENTAKCNVVFSDNRIAYLHDTKQPLPHYLHIFVNYYSRCRPDVGPLDDFYFGPVSVRPEK